ncbi:MAG: hypothetical protein HUU06_11265 [Planctomycetaceae bacterium]|nr:hypothetical protein [Planctomycetota bacterium]NUN53348.1 hypothetical protein [Planctomycetaceae bacterium]
MTGESVPFVLIPRFTSYVGEGTYTTLALDVTAYSGARLEFWRGKLLGFVDTMPVATFEATFEEANQADAPEAAWTGIGAVIDTPDDNDLVSLEFTKRYFRVRIVLVDSSANRVALTCWAAGNLVRRIAAATPDQE